MEKFTFSLLDEHLAEKIVSRGNLAKNSLMFIFNLVKERAEYLERKASHKLAKQLEEKAKLCEEAVICYMKEGYLPQLVQEVLVRIKRLNVTEKDFK